MSRFGGRAWEQAPDVNTLHCFGDVHMQTTGIRGTPDRQDAMIWDMNHGDVPDVQHHFLGDLTESGTAGEDAAFLAFTAAIPNVKNFTIGNHDVDQDLNARTPAQWAAAYATPGNAANYTYDLPFGVRVISVSFDSMADGSALIVLSQATLDYLDAQLTAAGTKDCWIMCHAPLHNTVLGGAGEFQSVDGGFFTAAPTGAAIDSSAILSILAAHPNVKAWISGHTHTSLEVPSIVTALTAGSTKLACISTSSVTSNARANERWTRMTTPYVTWFGDKIEVRWREHFQKSWAHPVGNPAGGLMVVTGL